MNSAALSEALREWALLLGDGHVRCDREGLRSASTATFATTSQVLAILRPGTRDDVQEVVRIANRHRVPIYPISTGKNWGYGSRVPARDGVLVDLGRMNRIVAFDEELAYVTIEPGVTQRQLYDYLQERGSSLWMDATGASPDCSIIGNTLERGFGHTPMGDHCAMRAVTRWSCRTASASKPDSAVFQAPERRPSADGASGRRSTACSRNRTSAL